MPKPSRLGPLGSALSARPSRLGPLGSALSACLIAFALFLLGSPFAKAQGGDAAQFISQTPPPAELQAGLPYPVTVTMKNTGTTTWTTDPPPANGQPGGYMLVSANPLGADIWNTIPGIPYYNNSVPISATGPSASVAPGQTATFTFIANAPSGGPGDYNFQWTMMHNFVRFFGDVTPNVVCTVKTDNAAFVSQVAPPATMTAGQSYPVSVTMQNTGASTWQDGTCQILSENPRGSQAFGPNTRPVVGTVLPGGSTTVSFNAVAPTTPGSYNFQWTLSRANIHEFGQFSTNVPVTVVAAPQQTGASGSYDVTTGPINIDVTENTSGTVTAATVIGVSSVNSFTGSVQLSVSGLPTGVSTVLSSPAVSLASGNASSNLAFTIASTTRPGFYAVDIRATSGSITRSAPVNLTVYPSAQAANFTVTEDVDGLEIAPGSSDSVSLAFSPNAGFSGTVNLSLQDDPAHPIINGTSSGIVATFNNSSVSSGSSTSTLTIQVGAQVAEGTYNLLVKAASSTATQTLMLTIFVSPDNTGAGFGFPTTPPSSPQSPPSPLASSVSDMSRDDLDDSNNGQSPSGQVKSRADNLGVNFDISKLHASNIHPNYLGATDDRKPIGAFVPYSAVCRINAYGSNGGQGWVSTGTGFLVGRNHVLTAAHVLYDNSGHLATKVFVYPGYNNGASRTFHRASAKSKFIPNNYKNEVATGRDDTYDDWALIDLNPVVAATRADRGKALGDLAGYVYAEDDFVNPDVAATIPGYPGAAAGLQLNSNYMYYSGVYFGDDGPVTDTPPGGYGQQSDNLVYFTIDISQGDSGAPVFRPDPVGNDDAWHAFAIARAANSMGLPVNDATLLTTTRKKIIQMLMQKDKDDISY